MLATSRPASGALIGQVEHKGLPPIQIYKHGNVEGENARVMAQEHVDRFVDAQRKTNEFNALFASACETVPILQHLQDRTEGQFVDTIEVDEAFLLPVTVRTGTVVVIVTRDGVTHLDLPELTSISLRMLVGQGRPDNSSWNVARPEPITFGYLGAYHRRRRDPEAWTSALEDVLEILGRALWEPVLASLPKNIRRLAFVPNGLMSLLPVHAAYRSVAQNLRPVMADFAFAYTPSADCFCLSRAVASGRRLHSLLCIVNPEEDETLRWTKVEGEAIRKFFRQNSVIEGHRANRKFVLDHSKNFSCVHVAAHAFFDWRSVRRSGLRMSDAPITVEDIWLGLWNLTAARLVVLSACETGIIDAFSKASSEMPGLPGALLLAGVPAVVGTLWPVNDIAAALVMSKFYSNHVSEGQDLPTALSRAQEWLRNVTLTEMDTFARSVGPELVAKTEELRLDLSARAASTDHAQPFRDPSYWAPYVCFGN